MKLVRSLLILILTLVLAVISLVVLHSFSSQYIPLVFVTLIYCSLIYLVWPLGTAYSEIAYKRFFIVLGLGLFMFSAGILLSNEYPSLPAIAFTKSSQLEAIIMLICRYFGKYPASLFIFGLGCYIIYLGYKKNLSHHLSGNC